MGSVIYLPAPGCAKSTEDMLLLKTVVMCLRQSWTTASERHGELSSSLMGTALGEGV